MQSVVTAFAWVLALAVLLGFILLMRYMGYREKLAAIESGVYEEKAKGRGGRGTLRWGIAITLSGLAISMGIYPVGYVIRSSLPLRLGPWMLVGLIPLFFGLSLILAYYLVREPEEVDKEENHRESPS